jgi:serine/threonine protein kinase
MAPEQARGEESGPPADFWALGATMFYAVEGEPPFDRGTSIATLAAVVNDPPRPPHVAGPLTPLITALLAKDPASRPSGRTVRAWLDWLLIVAPSARPTKIPRTQRHRRAQLSLSISESAAAPAPPPDNAALTPPGAPRRCRRSSRTKTRPWRLRGQRRSSGHLARSSHQPHPCPTGPVGDSSAWLPCYSSVGC